MSNIPLATGQLPAGMAPDDNLGPLSLRIIWILLSISTVIVGARLVVKCKTTRRIYWDDFLMILALVSIHCQTPEGLLLTIDFLQKGFGYAHAVTISISISTGFGRHIYYLNPHEREATLRVGFYSLAWGFLSPLAGRLGFMVFLLFVAGTDPLIKKWWLYIFMFLQTAINLVAIIVLYTQCGNELDILWNQAKQIDFNSKCKNPIIQSDYGYFQGCRAMIASIVKTYEARALSEILDYTHDLVIYVIWISIELNVVMITATIPLLRPLFRRDVFPFGRRPRDDSGTMLSSMTSLPRKGWENITMDSMLSKKDRFRSQISEVHSSASTEDIQPSREIQNPFGITRTMEVQITYEANDKPHVHAALVGLCPGVIDPHSHTGYAA
ncbi:MAG: hypothetical protein Q9157_006879 [Trypethelium eluteriae]